MFWRFTLKLGRGMLGVFLARLGGVPTGKHPKMDGVFHGRSIKMDDLEENPLVLGKFVLASSSSNATCRGKFFGGISTTC